MSTKKNARADDVRKVGWEEIDRLVVAARFNGTMTPALAGILRAYTDALGATAREIGEAYLDAFRMLDAREKLRAAARRSAIDEIADLEVEAGALTRRRARAETVEIGPDRIVDIAHGLAGMRGPPPDVDTASRDADRLDDLNARISALTHSLALLGRPGRPQTAARELAERLAPIWRQLTGEDVTASRSAYGAARFSGFESFFRASAEWLTGARPSPTLTRSVAAATASSAENPKA